MRLSKKSRYNKLIENIGYTLQKARESAVLSINAELVKANWQIGKYIVEYEQNGQSRADYGTVLMETLSKDLSRKLGKGFSRSNLQMMRTFYIKYPDLPVSLTANQIRQTVSGEFKIRQTLSGESSAHKTASSIFLSWSHYSELLSVSDDLARSFYEKQAIRENWSFRELKRQIDSSLFERLALSKNKKGVLALAKKGNQIITSKDVIKDPFVFEFLEIKKSDLIKERGLETKLISSLQNFLLELGKGFSFVARQFKISIDNEHSYIDLVFYHRILKCFVLIDIKIRKVKHSDIGQMNLYLNYFKEEEGSEGDNEPIGIIIAPDKHDLMVKYATGGLSNKIFVSKYQLYLPDKKLLEKKVKEIMNS